MAVALLLASCGDGTTASGGAPATTPEASGDSAATTPAATSEPAAPPPATPSEPVATTATAAASETADAAVPRPTAWSGIRSAGEDVEIVSTGQVLHVDRAAEDATAEAYTDVDHGEPVLWATCCEPVTGTTHAVEGFREHGARVDRVSDRMVRVAADGTVFIREAGDEEVLAFAGVVDAALVGDVVVALRDFGQVPDPVGEEPGGLALVHIGNDVSVTEVAALSATACAVVRYGQDAVAVLHPDPDGPVGPLYCRGTRMTVLDASTGEQRDELTLDEQAVHVSSDDTGHWLLLTSVSGAVSWLGVDGSSGRLAESGYVRADW